MATGLKLIHVLQKKDPTDSRGWVNIRTYTTEEAALAAKDLRERDEEMDHILFSVQPIELEG